MKAAVVATAGACVALAVACGAQRSAPAGQAAMMAPASPDRSVAQLGANGDPRREIDELSRHIDTDRATLQLPEQHGTVGATAMSTAPETPQCTRAPGDVCTQTCTLADSICGNSKKICELADQMTGDAWAAQKCADGQATCVVAMKRCCDCTT